MVAGEEVDVPPGASTVAASGASTDRPLVFFGAAPPPRKHHIAVATMCLWISIAMYAICMLVMLVSMLFIRRGSVASGLLIMTIVNLAIFPVIAFIVGVIWGLNRRKQWAWIAGLFIFALYLPTPYLPLGAFGMWALLEKSAREEFGIGRFM